MEANFESIIMLHFNVSNPRTMPPWFIYLYLLYFQDVKV